MTEIIEYIGTHDGPTKNEVVRYMEKEGFCTHVTTRMIIDSLLKEKKVVFSKRTSKGFYHLYLNDENEFNQIYSELTEIENIIDRMKHRLISNPMHLDKLAKQPRHEAIPIEFYTDTFYYYRHAVNIMLQLILFRTKSMIHAEIDADIIYKKTLELMIRLTLQTYELEDPRVFLDVLAHSLKTLKPKLPAKKGKHQIVSNEFINDFMRRIESFEKHVLTL